MLLFSLSLVARRPPWLIPRPLFILSYSSTQGWAFAGLLPVPEPLSVSSSHDWFFLSVGLSLRVTSEVAQRSVWTSP